MASDVIFAYLPYKSLYSVHMLTEVILEGGVHRILLSVFYDFILLSFKNVCMYMYVYYFTHTYRKTDLYNNNKSGKNVIPTIQS